MAVVKIQIPAAKATPAPPVGTALGPHGVNMAEFCKAFNDRTKGKEGSTIPVEITIYKDRSYTFFTKEPPMSELIRKSAGIEKGSPVPNRDKVATISEAQLESIAKSKMADLNAFEIEAAKKIVMGTARSMGVELG